jgi:hypothetical protein
MWGYIGILHAAAAKFPACKADVAKLLRGCKDPSQLGTTLARGDETRLALDNKLRLTYQQRITPLLSSIGLMTPVVEAIPDVCVLQLDDAGQCERLVVLDPKYRAGASLLEGIRDLHVYRDAIVSAAGERRVVGSVALAPRPPAPLTTPAKIPSDRPAAYMLCPPANMDNFVRLLASAMEPLAHTEQLQ